MVFYISPPNIELIASVFRGSHHFYHSLVGINPDVVAGLDHFHDIFLKLVHGGSPSHDPHQRNDPLLAFWERIALGATPVQHN